MLKGLLIAASGTEELRQRLTKEKLPWIEVEKREHGELQKEAFQAALQALGAGSQEVLCLVETDRAETIARELGLHCVGCLNPDLKEERLSGCRILLEGFQEIDAGFLRNVHMRAMGLPVRIAETERLLIREMTLADMDDVNALYQEGEFVSFAPELALNPEEEEEKIQAYISYMYGLYQFGMWVIIEKKSGRLIGRAGFGIADYLNRPEIDLGYLIGKDCRRQGYAEEACRAVLAYARDVLDFPEVSAYIDRENRISLHLIEKLGFRKEEVFSCQGRSLCRYLLSFRGNSSDRSAH